jgi:putative drug exporter of the RND superfamily
MASLGSGRSSCSPGLIMSSVFIGFASVPDQISKMFAVGLASAILIDVLVVRLTIAPAVVTLLGDRAWWLPAWLDRTLPNISLEGHMVEGVDELEGLEDSTPEPVAERVAG